jgi:hypothetical protein
MTIMPVKFCGSLVSRYMQAARLVDPVEHAGAWATRMVSQLVTKTVLSAQPRDVRRLPLRAWDWRWLKIVSWTRKTPCEYFDDFGLVYHGQGGLVGLLCSSPDAVSRQEIASQPIVTLTIWRTICNRLEDDPSGVSSVRRSSDLVPGCTIADPTPLILSPASVRGQSWLRTSEPGACMSKRLPKR